MTDFRPKRFNISSSKNNQSTISGHKLEPLISSKSKKNSSRCLDLCDCDSSFSSDFGTAAKFPRAESSSRCCIDQNDIGPSGAELEESCLTGKAKCKLSKVS